MLGLDRGIIGTALGGSVLVAIVYVLLANSRGFFTVSQDAAKNFGKYAKVAQGA